jgi:hypothetical protein
MEIHNTLPGSSGSYLLLSTSLPCSITISTTKYKTQRKCLAHSARRYRQRKHVTFSKPRGNVLLTVQGDTDRENMLQFQKQSAQTNMDTNVHGSIQEKLL